VGLRAALDTETRRKIRCLCHSTLYSERDLGVRGQNRVAKKIWELLSYFPSHFFQIQVTANWEQRCEHML
jgi:hypothetical protein